MRILALVTAKSYSERVPHKNLIRIAGKPLYKWTTDFLRDTQDCFTAVAFSSDKPEQFDIPSNFYMIQRPSDLCKESASHRSVVIHALDYMRRYLEEFDYVMLFQPTNPFRKKMDLLRLIVMTEEVRPTNSYMYYIDDNLKAEYVLGLDIGSYCNPMIKSGNMYLYSVPWLRHKGLKPSEVVTMEIPKWRGYNINTGEDFYIAEALYKANNEL